MTNDSGWPKIPYADWSDTCRTLHLWTQIVGKVRLVRTPLVNHWWNVTLYVTSRGLGTSPMPYEGKVFSIDFDFIDHRLAISVSDGTSGGFELAPMTVADFYRRTMSALARLGIDVRIHPRPNEIADGIPFERDLEHRSYDPLAVGRFWRALVQIDRVFTTFRSRFLGKVSPVHFWWGSFDHAVTRFSGRRAPPHPGGIPALPDSVVREAYSHEVSSAGFWPGGAGADAAFYSYAYPEPEGFSDAPVAPDGAFYSRELHEFLLPYEAVRRSPDPDAALTEFLQSTWERAADLGRWDRQGLERH
ncbi:MAG TPA: DUF5996 family protein [Thermoanaerobaculia bacterium]|nr:DUF5996 family protein [Thermoanaerobaculia bacterium]